MPAHRMSVEQIWKGLPATLSLCIGAAVIWMTLAIWFGYLSALHAGKFTDRALTILSLVGISMPVFWLAAILLYYFSFKAQLFPTSSYVPLTKNPVQWAYHLILPWFTLAVLFIGFYSRLLRSNMLDVMNDDHVRTARAKGISERQVRIKHVLRNSMIPIITLFGLDFGAVVGGGAILTETVYNLNGVGLYAGEAIGSLDLPPLMGVTLFGAFFIVLFNTLVDIAYAFLDPRIRLGRGGTGMSHLLSVAGCGSASPPRTVWCAPLTGCRSGLPKVRCSRSSANPAPARASPRRPCWG